MAVETILTQKRNDTYFLLKFFWPKGLIFKFNITEFFCFLIKNIFAAFEVAAKSCIIFLDKMQKNKLWCIKVS